MKREKNFNTNRYTVLLTEIRIFDNEKEKSLDRKTSHSIRKYNSVGSDSIVAYTKKYFKCSRVTLNTSLGIRIVMSI